MQFVRKASVRVAAGVLLMPAIAGAWTGTGAAPGTEGYVVDTTQRNDVLSFWHSVYQASEGYQDRIAWSGGNYGSVALNSEGTIAPAFVNDVKRRVNWMRAMCGVPANCKFNADYLSTDPARLVYIFPNDPYTPTSNPVLLASTLKAQAAQRSAFMSSISATLSHSPAPGTLGFTTAAWNGSARSNLAYGSYGPTAVDYYFQENIDGASENSAVGHRRWLLNPQATSMATGDVPGRMVEDGAVRAAANALYVVQRPEEQAATVAKFVPYPPAGFFPAKLNSKYWSLSYPGANFSAATVTVKRADNSTVGLVSILRNPASYADNAIVWEMPSTDVPTSVTTDVTYTVTVGNIFFTGNPTAQSKTYTVSLIDPDRIADPLTLTGPTSPTVAGGTYTFARSSFADAMEVGFFRVGAATWTEGAETATPPVFDYTRVAGAPLISNTAGYFRGTKAYHLTFLTGYDPSVNGVPDQMFELDRDVVAGSNATVNFWLRRGYMTPGSQLLIETSADGINWVGSGTIAGNSNGSNDAAFTQYYSSIPTGLQRVRFRLHAVSGAGIYTHKAYPSTATNAFIDDISFTNCNWLEKMGSVTPTAPTAEVTFNSSTAGVPLSIGQTWWLRLRTKLGGHWFPGGPALVVTPKDPLLPVGAAAPPVVGATYLFTPTPGAESHTLGVTKQTAVVWSEGAEASPAPLVIDGTGAYDLISTKYFSTGTQSFRLALDSAADSLDTFEINRDIIPTATSALTFKTRRRAMLTTNFIHAEVSTDSGVSWVSAWNLPGVAVAEGFFTNQSVSLASYAGKEIRVRFAFKKDPTASTTAASNVDAGVWIDDVAVSNGYLVKPTTLSAIANSFRLDATTAGAALVANNSYRLSVRPTVGGVPGSWGQALTVTPTGVPLTGYSAWENYDYPSLLGVPFNTDSDGDGIPNGIEYAFSLNPLAQDGTGDVPVLDSVTQLLKITRPLPVNRTPSVTYNAEWSDNLTTWSSVGVVVTLTGGQAVATVPKGITGHRYIRWKIGKP